MAVSQGGFKNSTLPVKYATTTPYIIHQNALSYIVADEIPGIRSTVGS